MSAKSRAKKVAQMFRNGDDYIAQHERMFDNQWEAGAGDAVAEQFRALYDADALLQRACSRSRYFSQAMIKVQKLGVFEIKDSDDE